MASYNVSNSVQLQAVLDKVVGGDKIYLSGGDYGDVTIKNQRYSSSITIASASPNNIAHFDLLNISDSSNIVIQGVDVGRELNYGESYAFRFSRINSSTNIKILDSVIHGGRDGISSNDGIGMLVRNVSDFTLSGTRFDNLHKAVSFENSTSVVVRNNRFEDLRVDAINVASTDRITIDKNLFTDFRPLKGDHGDAIQFHNTNQLRGSTNISITNNVVLQGDGKGVQGIFLNNSNGYDYRNVTIKNNLVYGNDFYHGIFVTDGLNVDIVGNTTTSMRGDKEMMWIRVNNSDDVVLSNNISDKIVTSTSRAVSSVQNTDMFTNSSFASLFPDLVTPSSPSDLIVPNKGYQLPIGWVDSLPLALESNNFPHIEAFVALP